MDPQREMEQVMPAAALPGGRYRHQSIPIHLRGVGGTEYNGSDVGSGVSERTLWNVGEMHDENHAMGLMPIARKYNLDIGGFMQMNNIVHNYDTTPVKIGSGPRGAPGIVRWYEGPLIAYPDVVNASPFQPDAYYGFDTFSDDIGTRIGMGATAISRCKPASPQASFGVFLGELVRDGIPSLLLNLQVKKEAEAFRSLGSDYLNVEFGWKPFVSDLIKTARSLDSSTRILEDLHRNSGKAIRRRYSFPTVETERFRGTDSMYPWPTLTVYHYGQSYREIVHTDSKKTWFSGEFVYRYPPVNSGILSQTRGWSRQILGVDLSPETLWNIAPWTWFGDWFANVGDVMSNISAIEEEDLAMRYGYLMQHSRREFRYTHYGVSTPWGTLPQVITGNTSYEVKCRIAASPFGFGKTWSEFSPKQLAILAALGITQSGRK